MPALTKPESESIVLAQCALYPERLYGASALLRPEDFSLSSNRLIFSKMQEMSATGAPVDVTTLTEALIKSRELEAVGGAQYLMQVLGYENAVGDLEYHAKVLLDCSRRRKIRLTCERGAAATEDVGQETTDCYALIQQGLLEIEASSSRTPAKRLKEFMPDVVRELEIQASQDGLVGLPTGISELDGLTGGIRAGQLWVIGALPGRGKTAIATQILLANGTAGNSAVAFSLEMAQGEIGKRILAAHSTVPASKIHNPRFLGKEGWAALTTALGQIVEYPIWIDDSPSLSIHELLARARLYVKRHGAKLVIVDYLRLVTAPGGDIRERVGYVADALRQFAKSERVAVVLLSQLRRPEGGLNARPSMIELKESGDIEAHAHVVLLLFAPVAADGRPTGDDEIIVGKNRHGAIGSLPVYFDVRKLQFFERRTKGDS